MPSIFDRKLGEDCDRGASARFVSDLDVSETLAATRPAVQRQNNITVSRADERPAKRPRRKFAIVLASLAAGLHAAAPAYGDEPAVRIGLTLNPVIGGIHESFDDRTHVPPVPIPLLELRGNYGPFEIDFEGLPPLASVRYNDTIQGTPSTRLSVFDGVARVWDPLHRFNFGLGQTLYNRWSWPARSKSLGSFLG